jgi:heme/copper-type cytochrome/quinol oxidase subunit 2
MGQNKTNETGLITYYIAGSLLLFLTTASKILSSSAFYQNDYLNPYTLTFKNPKTVEMLNIIILYHYIMAFLVGVVIFTFTFIFLSFFRSYLFFHYKPRFTAAEEIKFSPKILSVKGLSTEYAKIINQYHSKLLKHKTFKMQDYKKDIQKSLNDQVEHAPLLEFSWVVLPAVILVIIAYPSVVMLYYNESYVDPVLNVSAIGNQ